MPKSLILALLHRVAPSDLPEILVEVEKWISKSDLSKLQTATTQLELNIEDYRTRTALFR